MNASTQPTCDLRDFFFCIIILESSAKKADYQPLYEESFLLVRAASEDEARERLRQETQPFSYTNEDGETISWQIKQIVDVSAVLDDTLSDYTDLYARHFRDFSGYKEFETLA